MRAMSDSDLQLATMLLGGFIKQDRTRYLEEGTSEELDARRALARLLRSNRPLDRQLRTSLADLLDPDPPAWEPRKIKFVSRRQGQHTDYAKNTQIALHVRDKVREGSKVKDAIKSAADAYAVSEDAVKKIWSRYRRLLEQTSPNAVAGWGN
jgi:hypothetical protein